MKIMMKDISCTVCGSALDPTDFGGYVHLDDEHEDHVPVAPVIIDLVCGPDGVWAVA